MNPKDECAYLDMCGDEIIFNMPYPLEPVNSYHYPDLYHHSSFLSLRARLSAKNIREAKEQYPACQIHRKADRKTDRCGSKSLR